MEHEAGTAATGIMQEFLALCSREDEDGAEPYGFWIAVGELDAS